MLRLIKPIRRRIQIRGKDYVLTVDAGGLELRPFGRRNGTMRADWHFIETWAAYRTADAVRERRSIRQGGLR